MRFDPWTSVDGFEIKNAFEISPKFLEDKRGFFSRLADVDIISENLDYEFAISQINNSFSVIKNTFRGFHIQLGEYAETKVVRCIRGSCIDFILDLRVSSPTFLKYGKLELSPEKRNLACLPKGCAHGILTTSPNTEVIYFVDNSYNPHSEFGLSVSDSIFNGFFDNYEILASSKDSSWPDFNLEKFKKLL